MVYNKKVMKIHKYSIKQKIVDLVQLNPNQIKLDKTTIVVTYSTKPLHQVKYHYDCTAQCLNDFNIIRLINNKLYS